MNTNINMNASKRDNTNNVNNISNNKQSLKRKNFLNDIFSLKRVMSFIIAVVMFISMMNLECFISRAASGTQDLRWIQDRVLNFNLNEENANDNELMVEWGIPNPGNYQLEFYTLDTYAYTLGGHSGEGTVVKHRITVTKGTSITGTNVGKPEIRYKHNVYIFVDSNGDGSLEWTNIDAEYIATMLEWDFAGQPAPGYNPANTSRIDYTIYEDASWKGKIYMLSGQVFKFAWGKGLDEVTNSEIDIMKLSLSNLNGMNTGTIFPFELLPQGAAAPQKIEVLKRINVRSQARRWGVTRDSNTLTGQTLEFTANEDRMNEIKAANPNKIRPGILLEINKPKKLEFNQALGIARFVNISPAEAASMNLTINFESRLDQIEGLKLSDLPETGDTYSIDIVGYDECINGCETGCAHRRINTNTYDPDNDPANGNDVEISYIARKGMNDSSIYNVGIILETQNGIVSTNVRSYTYINYEIIRRNIDETYVAVQPYEFPGTYEIFVVNTRMSRDNLYSTNANKWAEHYISSSEDIPERIYIPIYITRNDTGTENNYTVGIRFKEQGMADTLSVDSEVRHYNANADNHITIDVPVLSAMKNIIVITDYETGDVRVAKATLTWKMPTGLFEEDGSYRILNNASEKLWYEVSINSANKNIENNKFQILDKISLTRLSNGNVLVEASSNPGWSKTFTRDDSYLEAEIVLKELNGEWAKFKEISWTGVHDNIEKPERTPENLPKIGEYAVAPDQTRWLNKFFNPDLNKLASNYFITARAFYDPVINDENLTISDYAVPVNIILDEVNEILPTPSKIEFTDVQQNTAKIKIAEANIDNFYQKMLRPVNATIQGSVMYEVFFSINEDNLLEIIDDEHIKAKQEMATTVNYQKLSNYEGSDAILHLPMLDIGTNDYGQTLSALRDGTVFSIKTVNPNISFEKLDENQLFYVSVRTVINIEDNGYEYPTFSEISPVYFTRTISTLVIPEQSEKMPPTPINFKKDGTPTDKEIIIRWEEPRLVDELGVKYGYEVLRVADNRLSQEDRSSMNKLEYFTSGSFKEVKGYRVFENAMTVYDIDTNTWIENNTNDVYENMILDNYMRIKDEGVNANRIYYYYIRTIKYNKNNVGEYIEDTNSEWAELTATTKPIKGVENLREITDYNAYEITRIEECYEAVIAFDAPVGDATISNTNPVLPSDVDFNIALKKSDESEYQVYEKLKLVAIASAGEDKATYVYRISTLKSGSRYNVKVQMVDMSSIGADGEYATSGYCDSISFRTEFSQDDYDKQEKYNDYRRYYGIELKKLINDLVYVIEYGGDNYRVKYKEEKLQGELGRTSATSFLLETKDDANFYEYYFSRTNLEEIKRLKKALKIVKDDVTIIIPYSFINEEFTTAYAELNEKCDDVREDVDDFLIKLSVSFKNQKAYVNGKEPISKQATVRIDLVELNGLSSEIDYILENDILTAIANDEDEFINEVSRRLKGKIDDAAFLEILDEKKEQLVSSFSKIVSRKLSSYDNGSEEVKKLYAPINIQFESNAPSAKIVAKTNGRWEDISTTHTLGVYNGYIKESGSYVLASSNDVQIKYGNEEVVKSHSMMTKYDLDGVLVRNGTFDREKGMVSQELFKDLALAILSVDEASVFEKAKIMQEVNAMFTFKNNPITKQEAIYNVLQLYNKFTNTDINRMNVKNAYIVADIKGIDTTYKQSLLIALELGIIDKSQIENPNAYITPNELLTLIAKTIG